MFFFFKQKTAYEMLRSLVGSEMCIRDSHWILPLSVQEDARCVHSVRPRTRAGPGGSHGGRTGGGGTLHEPCHSASCANLGLEMEPAVVFGEYASLHTHEVYWGDDVQTAQKARKAGLAVGALPARGAIVGQRFGDGRLVVFGPHPEDNVKTRWLLRAAFLWVME
eukprot:TRINITY_DN62430_c0_g1_i1.p2 TRINITY_DN62430_c0_g1~~TRINITY_DN62430_c0_g1_i1.p2  ORF type:complete len:165 (-),score=26.17 TRINITY_DN62430_c0_g1_i1:218-712(-)